MHPSHQVRISVIFEIRAHTTEPTTGRRMCDGPSTGNCRVINEIYPTRPGWTPFQNLTVYTPHPSIFHPITSNFLTSPLSFQLPHFPSLIIAPKNHLSLIIIIYLSVLLLSVSTLPESFSVCLLLHFQGMCLYIYTYLSCILVL